MAGAAALFQLGDEIAHRRHGGDLAALGDGRIDARQILHHHPAGTGSCADFGITHLPDRRPT